MAQTHSIFDQVLYISFLFRVVVVFSTLRSFNIAHRHGYARAHLPICCWLLLTCTLCVCVEFTFFVRFVSFFSNHSCCVCMFFIHPSIEHVVINVGVSRFACCYFCCRRCCCCCLFFCFSVRKSYITVKSHTP